MNKTSLFKTIADRQEDYDTINTYDVNSIVVQDLKSQSNEFYSPGDKEYKTPPTQEDYGFLYSNLKAWRNELIRIKQNVEMHLTNSRHKIAKLHLESDRADTDNESFKYRDQIMVESAKRIHSVKFLQSVELRLLDVRDYIADEFGKHNQY